MNNLSNFNCNNNIIKIETIIIIIRMNVYLIVKELGHEYFVKVTIISSAKVCYMFHNFKSVNGDFSPKHIILHIRIIN